MVSQQWAKIGKMGEDHEVKYVPHVGSDPSKMMPGKVVMFRSKNGQFSLLISVLALVASLAFFTLVLSWLWGVPEAVKQNKQAISDLKKIVGDQGVEGQSGGKAKGATGEVRPSKGSQGVECDAEPEVGSCRAAFPRWYYDKKTRTCKTFTWGGCEGNGNNFENEETCLLECGGAGGKPDRDPICSMKKDMGRCRSVLDRFFFNPWTGKCESFIYGGCDGNKNNFETIEECKSTCPEGIPEL